MSVAAVIVAGGTGARAGGEMPKQYQLIGGKPVIWWTLKSFTEHPGIDYVQPVIAEGHEQMFGRASEGLNVEPPVSGGATRQDSCRAGLEAVAHHNPKLVLIHDGARPFASAELISHVIASLDRHAAVAPGLPVADTLKLAPGGVVQKTLDRSGMWTVQTPQGFRFETILAAHRAARDSGISDLTDDAAVAERAGIEVVMAEGRIENRKITTAKDLTAADRYIMAAHLASLPDIRVGNGFDVHPFAAGVAVTLCGVAIPHDQKLRGHSDADVAMHALTDAILGAIGEGDIGVHFPPSEAQWKGTASSIFLNKAVECVNQRGGLITNVDITILAEAPRITSHIPAMKAILASLLGISRERIAIKATTMEGLGAIGRREGIAAFATATVRLP